MVASRAGDAGSSGAEGADPMTCEVSVIVDDWCSCASWFPEAISLRGVSKISVIKKRTAQRKRNFMNLVLSSLWTIDLKCEHHTFCHWLNAFNVEEVPAL